jgi:hypothetical protein
MTPERADEAQESQTCTTVPFPLHVFPLHPEP